MAIKTIHTIKEESINQASGIGIRAFNAFENQNLLGDVATFFVVKSLNLS